MTSRKRIFGISPWCRRYFLFLLACVLYGQVQALAQAPQLPGLKIQAPLSKNTPRQVMDASAKLVQPYELTSKLRLAISIQAPKMQEEEQLLRELQDRTSPNFKKYLTPAQWNARFAPAAQDEQAVVDWLTSRGFTITGRYPNRLMVNVEGTVDTIQKAFNITINRYAVNGLTEFSNDRDPVIPGNLAGILTYVDGLNSIQRMRPASTTLQGVRGPDYSPGPLRQHGPSGGADAKAATAKLADKSKTAQGKSNPDVTNGFYDPSDLWSSNMYDYNALMAQGHCCNPAHLSGGTPPETSIGLATDGDFADSDMYSFVGQYGLASHWYREWVGGTPGGGDDETTLDVEWSTAMSNSRGSEYDTSSVYVYEAANGFGDFGTLYQQMLNDNLVRTVNISYGLAEFDFSSDLVNSWHSIFNQMVGQGWTIMAAAGDKGAAQDCTDRIATIYPGSDPDIVSVGGTQLELYSDGTFYSEVTWTGDTSSGSCSVNHGGTGGGCSTLFAAPGYQTSPACGSGSRSIPDIAMNASDHSGQNFFFNGSLQGVAGTSISSPMMSGFVAQENAYLLAIGLGGSPLGQLNYKLYYLAQHSGNSYEAHYPFYDITSGCNSNDVTNYYGLGSYCAGTGYDLTTGWGSFNALQLAWGINTYDLGDFGAPTISFSGPSITQGTDNWYNTDQTVSWTVADTGGGYTPTGVAGFSQAWDAAFSDPTSEATPGSGNSFYSGPQFPNATSGYLLLSWAGQGCHYATVDAWDNSGITSGNQYYYYLCYDTIAPVVSASNSPAANSAGYNKSTVSITLSASDPGSAPSGIKTTYYQVDNTSCTSSNISACSVYSGAISISSTGTHYVGYFTKDVAGNFSGKSYDYVYIDEVAPVTTATLTGTVSGSAYSTAVKVTLSPTDNYSGVASTTYSLDGGSNTTYSGAFTVSTLGAHTVKYYSVDYAGNTETTKSVSFTIISPTSTTLTSSLNPSTNGQSVTLTATVTASVSGTPAGTITFKNGSTTLGTATLSSGHASLTTSALPVGSDALTANYGGATYDSTSSGSLTETVHETTSTTVTSSLNPSSYGQSITLTATVKPSISGTPTGSVQFFDGSTSLGTSTLSSAKATLALSTLSAGSHSITAKYLGDSTYVTSTSSALSQKVNVASTTTTLVSSLNPAAYGQSVTFTATVAGSSGPAPTGTVTFKHGTSTIGTGTLSSGKATFTTTTLSVGTDSITAEYAGDTDDTTSTSSAVSQVIKAETTTTTLTSSLNPAAYGQSVTFTAKVTAPAGPTVTGTVTFMHGATAIGTGSLSSGTATFTTSTLSIGTDSITAVYAGDLDDATSTSAALSQVIKAVSTTTTLASSLNPAAYGKSVTFTATVTATSGPTPTGTVTFMHGTGTLGTGTLSSGKATFTTTTLSVGNDSITAVYGGNTDDATSTSAALSEVIQAETTKTTLVSSVNPSSHGQSVTFTATVTAPAGPTPTGTVTFMHGTSTLGTATLSSGKASFATATLSVGTDSITAVYAGDTDDATSTSAAVSQVVNQAATSTSVASSLNPSTKGQTVTFTAKVTSSYGTPTGNVSFYDGSTVINTVALSSGSATYATSTLASGTHSIKAVYAAYGNFSGSTSSVLSQKVN